MNPIISYQNRFKFIRGITLIILIFIFLSTSNLFSQVKEKWVARYYGQGDEDHANALAIDSSGNVYVTGGSYGSGTDYDSDYATIKYNSSGVEQWMARYNGPGNSYDCANAIAIDSSGSVYVTGGSYGSGTYYDYATIKYNSSGVEEWVARYNGPGSDWDKANAIALDSLGNVYVTGWSYGSETYEDYATIKYDNAGVEQWVIRYNGPKNFCDCAWAIALDDSRNVYVTGGSDGSGTGYDWATIKYNSVGVEEWVARYNGPEDNDVAWAIALDSSGNVYVTGYSDGSGTGEDIATIKYNNAGVEQWVARYNGPGNGYDDAKAIAIDSSENVYVTGYSYGSGTGNDYATIKYDSSGVEQWVARYNSPWNSYDEAGAIALDNSGNIYVTGLSYSLGAHEDYATIKYNNSGIEQWVARYNGPDNFNDGANAITLDSSGNVYVAGYSRGIVTSWDYATIKYSQSTFSECFYLY